MGAVENDPVDHRPIGRTSDCALKAKVAPAGFLKVTTAALDHFMRCYPELCYGPQYSLSVDLFHHGAHKGLWWGEDYAFCRNYIDCGGDVWIVPDLNIDHWSHNWQCPKCGILNGVEHSEKCKACSTERGEVGVFRGNYHEFLLRCPGGSKDPAREQEVHAIA